jgi:hypothetical protein
LRWWYVRRRGWEPDFVGALLSAVVKVVWPDALLLGTTRVDLIVQDSKVEEGRGIACAIRFPSPLIKPDVRISRIRLSDWLHSRFRP